MTHIHLSNTGYLTLSDDKRTYIVSSPLGTLVMDNRSYLPESATVQGDTAIVRYPCGECTIKIEGKNGYHKLTVLSVPKNTYAFIFGPYKTLATSYGEVLGAGWFDDGAVSCIQSLMPKVVAGFPKLDGIADLSDMAKSTAPSGMLFNKAAISYNGEVTLQCSVRDLSKEAIIDDKNTVRLAVPGPDGKIENSSIALIGADNADSLLDTIGEMEVAEGLPHPTYQGNYAKKDKRVSSIYYIIKRSRLTSDEILRIAERANITCIYYADIFGSWGHFPVNTDIFPGGSAEVHAMADRADKNGIVIGAHTLSNFIHTHDKYITPVPNKQLLYVNKTTLTVGISATDTEISIADAHNFEKKSCLNSIRIGEEIIKFAKFDPETNCLSGCTRGAFGTIATSHESGEEVFRLADNGYRTFYPDINLQSDMATKLGNAIIESGIRRLSFDGLEGCMATNADEYAPAEFVRKVYEITGSDFTCDASRMGHYLWHALSYANWGEPWCDTDRRGGLFADRVNHIPFFKRNLIPLMMGWYMIHNNRGRFEATPPENMEYILSRSAAFDAGLAVRIDSTNIYGHGLFNEYLDLTNLWGDFRFHADIPEEVRRDMQRENSNWHLEKTEDGWKLYELMLHYHDLEYCANEVETETGSNSFAETEKTTDNLRKMSTMLSPDSTFGEGKKEVYRFRIRVGEPGHGKMINPEFTTFGLKFELTAEGGDYLVYNGGLDLYHYDCNYNLKQIVTSEGGRPIELVHGMYNTMKYTVDSDEAARYIMTDFRIIAEYDIKPKK